MRAACVLVAIAALVCLSETVAAQDCGTHTIQAGDTFFDLAQAQGFSVDAIKAANPGVVPERLQVGQVVNLPCQGGGGNNGGGNPDKGTGSGGCGSYTIKAGDTFWDLAQARGMSVEAIRAVNPGVMPEKLQVGQTINLPCQGGGGNNNGGRSQPQPQPVNGGGSGMCAAMLSLVNQARASAGQDPLSCSRELDNVAQAHSNDQARMRHMTHDGQQARLPFLNCMCQRSCQCAVRMQDECGYRMRAQHSAAHSRH